MHEAGEGSVDTADAIVCLPQSPCLEFSCKASYRGTQSFTCTQILRQADSTDGSHFANSQHCAQVKEGLAGHLLVDGVDEAVVELVVELVLDLLVLVQLVGDVLAQLSVHAVILVVQLVLLQDISSLSIRRP